MRDAIAAAGNLLTAWASGGQQLIAARERYPSWVTTIDDVYAVHGAMATHPLADALGGLAGYKQGSIGMVDGEPCVYGPLFRACFVEAPAGLSVHDANLFAMEAEFAFVLGADLAPTADGAPRSEAEVWDAVAEVALAIELVGTRHTLADATNFEKLADACCAAGVVLGPRLRPRGSAAARAGDGREVGADELAACLATLSAGGVPVGSGLGSACPLGSPLAALAWCANHLNARGLGLKAGHVVIGGAIAKGKPVHAGVEIVADFGTLGMVSTVLSP